MMASEFWLSTLFVILTLIDTLGIDSPAAQEDAFPYLTDGQVFISADVRGANVRDSQSLNGTDYYFIKTNFVNNDQETKSFSEVYFVVLVIDQDGYAHVADLNT